MCGEECSWRHHFRAGEHSELPNYRREATISLFLLCFQQLGSLQDWEWLAELFQQMKYHVQKMTPEEGSYGGDFGRKGKLFLLPTFQAEEGTIEAN